MARTDGEMRREIGGLIDRQTDTEEERERERVAERQKMTEDRKREREWGRRAIEE